jgi:hypothetical protein
MSSMIVSRSALSPVNDAIVGGAQNGKAFDAALERAGSDATGASQNQASGGALLQQVVSGLCLEEALKLQDEATK